MKEPPKQQVQVQCPVCGYRMPVYYEPASSCKGIFVICKGRSCKVRFEVKIQNGKQVK